jgi:N,N'-diacetylchitobiose phosphorylase
VVDPCIPADWGGFEAVRIWRGAAYNITVKNPDGVEKGVKKVLLNGTEINSGVLCQKAGSVNFVEVIMGEVENDD